MACDGLIDLRVPVDSRPRKGFRQAAFVYRCPKCGAERVILASSFRGKRPVPMVGAVVCGK